MKKWMLKDRNYVNIISFMIATVWVGISFWNDFHFFDFSYTERISYFTASGNPYSVAFYILMKIIFIGIIYIFSYYVAYLIKGVLKKDPKVISLLKVFGVIAIVYCIVLILIYPGLWFNNGVDEFQVFEYARRLQVQYHQGVITSMCYIVALMFWPKPVMIILFQMIIGTIILGNIGYDIKQKSKLGGGLYLLLILSPAALYYANYPLRAYLFAVFFLGFLHYFMKYFKSGKFTLSKVYFLTFLLCIVVNLRIEAFYLIFIFPFLFIKKIPIRHVILSSCVLIFSIILFSEINKLGFQGQQRSHNSLSLIAPLSLYLADENRYSPEFEEDIKNIDKVYDVKILKEKAATNCIEGSRDEKEYSEEEYRAFLKSTIKILFYNPDLVLYSKLTEAAYSLGLSSLSFVNRTLNLKEYSSIGTAFPKKFASHISKSEPYFRDFDIESHNLFTRILGGQFEIIKYKAYDIFYAFWLPSFLLFAILIGSIIKKNKVLCIADLLILIHFLITVLTEPSRFQMYFFAEYLIGWYLLIASFTMFKKMHTKK